MKRIHSIKPIWPQICVTLSGTLPPRGSGMSLAQFSAPPERAPSLELRQQASCLSLERARTRLLEAMPGEQVVFPEMTGAGRPRGWLELYPHWRWLIHGAGSVTSFLNACSLYPIHMHLIELKLQSSAALIYEDCVSPLVLAGTVLEALLLCVHIRGQLATSCWKLV